MRIQTNTAANSALGYMRVNNQATERSIQKLSSGFRINRSGDDAAGLAIANKLRADVRGLSQAQRNTAQGTSMLQVMDGATQTVSSILDRMKELATQANSANIGTQTDKLNAEFGKLREEIQRIAKTTQYQGTALVDGTFGASIDTATSTIDNVAAVAKVSISGAKTGADITFTNDAANTVIASQTLNGQTITQSVTLTAGGAQSINFDRLGVTIETNASFVRANDLLEGTLALSGTSANFQVSSSGRYANSTDGDLISMSAVDLTTGATGVNLDGLDLLNAANAQTTLGRIDAAITKVNDALGSIGAAQSRFDFAASNVATMLQNTQAAESTIRDADMAEEMTKFTKNNILQQAAQSMLSQANQGTQGILQLLRG
jgi:flagellin